MPGAFDLFAQGFNQTVRGWGNDIAGTTQQIWGTLGDDESMVIRGAINDEEGDYQTERGWNLMASGFRHAVGLAGGDSDEEGARFIESEGSAPALYQDLY